MLISELLPLLERALREHGDLPVMSWTISGFGDVDLVRIDPRTVGAAGDTHRLELVLLENGAG